KQMEEEMEEETEMVFLYRSNKDYPKMVSLLLLLENRELFQEAPYQNDQNKIKDAWQRIADGTGTTAENLPDNEDPPTDAGHQHQVDQRDEREVLELERVVRRRRPTATATTTTQPTVPVRLADTPASPAVDLEPAGPAIWNPGTLWNPLAPLAPDGDGTPKDGHGTIEDGDIEAMPIVFQEENENTIPETAEPWPEAVQVYTQTQQQQEQYVELMKQLIQQQQEQHQQQQKQSVELMKQ
ncbi:putative uncharacterized protein DDB_G0294196, partial [Anopheles cruzii]|uniref:putative uncharacterized protein DDB_G0294196 n=1 Tax=Anopheles cruzii TaxID=68878 RepID=UPI0022EC6EA5